VNACAPRRRRLRAPLAASLAAVATFFATAPGARAEAPAALRPALQDRIELGPRSFELSLDVAPPASGVLALSGEARIEMELLSGADLALRQHYEVGLDGQRLLGASRLELGRTLELGPATNASFELRSERAASGLAHGASTQIEHRFTPATRAALALDLGSAERSLGLAGRIQLEHCF